MRQPLLIVGCFVGVAPFLGALWERIWTPNTGVVVSGKYYEGFRVEGNVLGADYEGMRSNFDAVAWFVIVGFVGCLVLGVLSALLARRTPLVTLAAVAVGAVAASVVAYRFGIHLGPQDPKALAAHAGDATVLPSRLHFDLHGAGRFSPFTAWPLAALAALATTYFIAPGASAAPDAGGAGTGEPHQVAGGELDVEPTPSA